MAPEDPSDDARARAEQIVPQNLANGIAASLADREILIQAVADDLRTASDDAVVAEERLLKLEAQTRVLAEAVVAITEPAVSVAPAVQAVKDEM